jgi:ubiquinone biosynthesis protein
MLMHSADDLVGVIVSMGAASPLTDRARLTQDAEVFVEKYASVRSVSDINVTEVFEEVMGIAAKHHVSMPGRFTILARSLTAIEGVVGLLCPELNVFDLLYDKMKERMLKNLSLRRELAQAGRELFEAGKKTARIPVLASEALDHAVKGKMKVNMELKGYDEPLDRIGHFVRYAMLTLVACVLFIGSCILCTTEFKPLLSNGMPLFAVAGIVFSIALAIFSVKNLK